MEDCTKCSWRRPDLPPKCRWHLGTKEKSPHHHYRKVRKPILKSVLDAIGDTPMVHCERLQKEYNLKCDLLAKCEFFNAGGSVKDRIGLRMVEYAEREGRIKPGYTIIEPTSGNTGIGLALACAVKGYRCIIVLPEKMSKEKVNVLKALGCEIVRTPTSAGFEDEESHIRVAQKLEAEIPNAVILDQYINPGNPVAHYDTTAEEILEQCGGHVDMLIAGAGTGGTISGIGRKLKERCPNIEIVGVDPLGSDLALPVELNKTDVSYYEVEGIGYDFIPTVCDRSVVDKWYKSNDKDSLVMARKLIQVEGLLCGGSSGTAMSIAVEAASKLKEGQKCVVVLPDSIRNYMTKHLQREWMVERNFLPPAEEELVTEHWWSHQPVKSVKLHIPKSILLDTSCGEAISLLKSTGFDQLPVVDMQGTVQGVVTVDNIMDNFISGKLQMTDPVSESLCIKFSVIHREDSLWTLSQILKTDRFAIVMGSRLEYDLCSKDTVKRMKVEENVNGCDYISGIVTAVDFLQYISSQKPKPATNGVSNGVGMPNGVNGFSGCPMASGCPVNGLAR